jgi:hypothetical protein
LQFDGTNFTTTGFATATSFRPSASTVPTNGMYLPAANTIGFATNSTLRMSIDANGNSGFGIAPIANVRLASYDTNATVYTSTGATASPVGSVLALGNLSNTNGGYVGISFGANQAAGTGSATYIGNFSNTGSLTGTMVFGRRTGSATYAESMRIDSAGNLGLGVTPSAWNTNWDVLETPTGAFASYATSDPTTIISSNAYISTTSSTTGSIYKNTGYATMYRQTQGAHTWFTAPSGTAGTAITFTTAMTLNANGGCQHLNTISVGNATPSTSGAGITFPATQSASTNANTLDDYEEGTWTPTSAGTTTSGTGTYTIQVGRYTKIGDVVYFYAFVSWSAHTGTGDLLLSSLPFTSSNTTALSPVVNVVGSSLTFLNQLYGGVNGNSTNVAIRTMSTSAATAAVAMDTAATLIVTGFYYV